MPCAVGDRCRRAAFPLDGDGFFDLSAVEPGIAEVPEPGAFVPTPVAAAKGALVLLGEPGAGKTTEFQRVIGGLKFRVGESSDVKVVEVDASDLTDATAFDELVGRHLQALPARTTELDASGGGDASAELDIDGRGVDLVLVIDQVDESPLLRHLATRLRNALAGRDTSRLCIVLGCRTADYPSELTEALQSQGRDCVLAKRSNSSDKTAESQLYPTPTKRQIPHSIHREAQPYGGQSRRRTCMRFVYGRP